MIKNKFLNIALISLTCLMPSMRASDPTSYSEWLNPQNITLIATGIAGIVTWSWHKFKTSGQATTDKSQIKKPNRAERDHSPNSSKLIKDHTEKTDHSLDAGFIDKSLDKLNDNIKIGNSQCKGKEIPLSDNATAAQIKVASQSNPKGGGSASCGYHAIKNCILINSELINKTENLHTKLNDFENINPLFDKNGTWRNQVIINRTKNTCKDFISNQLKKFLKPASEMMTISDQLKKFLESEFNMKIDDIKFNWRTIREKYINLIYEYSQQLVDTIFNSKNVTINFEGFLNFLSQAPIKITDKSSYLKSLNGSSSIDLSRLFRETKFIEHCFYKNESISSNLPRTLNLNCLDEIINNSSSQVNRYGEWLHENEIREILQNEQKIIDPNSCTIIEDINIITPEHDFMPEWQKLQSVHRDLFKSENDDYMHNFIIGTMDHESQANSGHWYSLIVKKSNGNRHYIIADSLNHCRLYNNHIKTIIGILERKDLSNNQYLIKR